MDKVLILGAGVYQTRLINTAKKMGYFTIVCSRDGNYPGFNIADRVYKVDTTDKEEILKIAKNENIKAICTSGTDVAITTIGYVCDALNLNGISYEGSKKATNKMLMKKAFIEKGINTAKYYVVNNVDELKDAFVKLNVDKAVIKIVDKSGSRGIRTINKEVNFNSIFEETIKQTNENYVLLEEFINGKEIGIDLFVVNGEIVIFSPHDKLVYQYNGIGIPSGHILPYFVDETINKNMLIEAKKIVEAYNIKNGAINIDAFIREDGEVYIIEAGARSGATGIPEIITINTGVDYYELIIKAALGKEIILNKQLDNKPCASLLVYSDKNGIYCGYNFDYLPGIEISIDYKKGDYIHKIEDGTDRIGMAIINGGSKEEVINKIDQFRSNFNLIVE